MEYALDINDFTFKYDDKILFENLNISLLRSSLCTFFCENGSGKSTLASIIKGDIDAGYNVMVFDKLPRLYKKDVFVIDANFGKCFKSSSIDEVIEKELLKYDVLLKNVSDRVSVFLELFGIDRDADVRSLSGSDKLVIIFLISLLSGVKMVVIDNIFEYLSVPIRNKMFRILKTFNEKELLTILNFTTNIEDALYMNELIIYKDKKVLMKGNTKEVLQNIDVFEENKIELPFVVSLSNKLMFYDLIDRVYYDAGDLVNAIWK